jgi:hypothetical protein
LATFGVRVQIFPRFATLVLIELHKNQSNSHNWIRLFYKNETDKDELWEWQIDGCEFPCTLKKLKEARRQYLHENGRHFEGYKSKKN